MVEKIHSRIASPERNACPRLTHSHLNVTVQLPPMVESFSSFIVRGFSARHDAVMV
jgi:hypothetical protein